MDTFPAQPIPIVVILREPAPDSLEKLLDAALPEPAPLRKAS